ncbi:hypothetical protein IQ07DRAFT_430002 [Pyrenochaeta sp. DS3sAY3a]|nr:hypothetical protein IQ07DRAFT_430002 [Pyrenochaeta sp. DS3sAY3a]
MRHNRCACNASTRIKFLCYRLLLSSFALLPVFVKILVLVTAHVLSLLHSYSEMVASSLFDLVQGKSRPRNRLTRTKRANVPTLANTSHKILLHLRYIG